MKDNLTQPENFQNTDELINNRYRVLKELGRGATGIVYLVQDMIREQKECVLKILNNSVNKDDLIIAQLRQEFSILSAIHHPNLVNVYDLNRIAGTQKYFFTMEFVAGKPYLEKASEYDVQQHLQLFVQIILALDYIHAKGLYHGDLKSDNLFIIQDTWGKDQVKIMDFGMSGQRGSKAKENIGGTLEYAAPELFRGSGHSIQSDIYALGILFYWALAGKPPFKGSPDALKKGHLSASPPALQGQVPYDLERIIMRMLAKEPDERYKSCEDILVDLENSLDLDINSQSILESLFWDGFVQHNKNILEKVINRHNSSPSDRDGQIITLSGSEGSGIDRVLDEIKNNLQMQEVNAYEIWCQHTHLSPFQPLANTFRNLDGFGKIEENFKEFFDKHFNADFFKKDNQKHRQINLTTFMDEWVSFFSELGQKNPVYIILRNAEQAADLLIKLFYYIARALDGQNVFICLTFSPEKSQAQALIHHENASLEKVSELSLEPFSLNEMEEFLKLAFYDISIPARFINDLIKHSGGHPSAVVSILIELYNKNYFIRSEGRWILNDDYHLTDLDLSNFNKIYLSLYSSLTENEKKLAQYIAVWGAAVTKPIIKSLNIAVDDVEDLFQPLVTKRLLRIFTIKDEEFFDFVSDSLRQFVYNSISATLVKTLHKEIVEYLKSYPDSFLSLHLKALHYLKSGDFENGFKFSTRSIKQLSFSQENRNALILARFTSSLAKKHKKRIRMTLLRRIAELEQNLGETVDAIKHFIQLVVMYRKGVAKSAVYRRISTLYQKMGDIDKATEALNSALKQIGKQAFIEQALVLRELAWIALIKGENKKSLELGHQALQALDNQTPSKALGLALNSMGSAYYFNGEIDKAIEYLHKSIDIRKKLHDDWGTAATLNNLGVFYNVAGKQEQAISVWTQGLELREKIGDISGIAQILMNMGVLLLERGQFSRAYLNYNKCKIIRKRTGDIRGLVEVLGNLGELERLREDFDSALSALEEGISYANKLQDFPNQAEMLYQQAFVYLELNQVLLANKSIDFCLNIAEAHSPKVRLAQYNVLKSRICLRLNDNNAELHLNNARELSHQYQDETLKLEILFLELEMYILLQKDKQVLVKVRPYLQNFNDIKFKWQQVELLKLLSFALIADKNDPNRIKKFLINGLNIADSLNRTLDQKNIHQLLGDIDYKNGNLVDAFQHYKTAYQCLRICITSLRTPGFKKSLLSLPENVELIKKIKLIKESIKNQMSPAKTDP